MLQCVKTYDHGLLSVGSRVNDLAPADDAPRFSETSGSIGDASNQNPGKLRRFVQL
jgi:hypothetical protein